MSFCETADSRPQLRKHRVSRAEFAHKFIIEAYGVRLDVATNNRDGAAILRERIANVIPEFSISETGELAEHFLSYRFNPSGRDTLYKDGRKLAAGRSREILLDRFASELRLTVAEFALDRVFIHAGAICWKGRAIVFPGSSFHGKSTLTAELVKRGAVYYSDEYAVLDSNGYLHPFAKKLSMRGEIDAYRQVDHPVEAFGGVAGTERVPVGMVLITRHVPNSKWKPKRLSSAAGIMEIIKHTLPIRRAPEFTLDVLKRIAERAPIVKTNRGDAGSAADQLIEYFEGI